MAILDIFHQLNYSIIIPQKDNKYLKDHIHASNKFIRKVLMNNFENYFFKNENFIQ